MRVNLEEAKRIGTPQTAAQIAAAWNEQVPLGSPVEYCTPAGDRRVGRTRSRAVDRDGLACLLVEGCSEFVQVAECEALAIDDDYAADVEKFSQTVEDADEWSVHLVLGAVEAVVLLGGLQMVLRHPMLRDGVDEILRGLAEEIQNELPADLAAMSNRGWNPLFDARARPVQKSEVRS